MMKKNDMGRTSDKDEHLGEAKSVVEIPSIDADTERNIDDNKETGQGHADRIQYGVNDTPPIGLSFLLGFQHYMAMFGSTVTLPFIIGQFICVDKDPLILSKIMSTVFLVSGISTTLQVNLGTRLPIVQGGTFSYLVATSALMSLPEWKCPEINTQSSFNAMNASLNSTVTSSLQGPGIDWSDRLRQISGNIMVASLFQMTIGFTGISGLLLKFIGPLTIAPTIALIGLVLFRVAADMCGSNWPIALTTAALIITFSYGLARFHTPIVGYSKSKGVHIVWIYGFQMFPVIMAGTIVWILCAVLTVAGAFTDDPNNEGYKARTDSRLTVLHDAKWIDIPYPFQWGFPTVSVAGVCSMLIAAFVGIIESIGDYYACASLAQAPQPPNEAINRGVGIEGVGCFIAGMFGSGNATTSYSQNVAAIGVTKVASRRVVQAGAFIMIFLAIFGKFGAFFTTIPIPVIGGMFIVLFGIIFSVGISTLRTTRLTSHRNLAVLGVSMIMAFVMPYWVKNNRDAIDSGSIVFDQVVSVLLTTEMAIGAVIALVLDNTLPGTLEERGLLARNEEAIDVRHNALHEKEISDTYDLPSFIQKFLNRYPCVRHIPFLSYRA